MTPVTTYLPGNFNFELYIEETDYVDILGDNLREVCKSVYFYHEGERKILKYLNLIILSGFNTF